MRVTTRSLSLCCALLWFLSAAAQVYSAAADFNGSWDITVQDEPRGRAWWLKIEGAGTAHPQGEFVSAFDGNLNPIEEISIAGDKLVFGFHPKSRLPGGENGTRHLVYTAELSNGTLHGTFVVENKPGAVVHWTGVRAPSISDRDDGSWRDGAPVDLFDGRTLAGWQAQKAGHAIEGWSVKDGLLTGSGKASDIVSLKKFWNFTLHAEFKVPQGSNSGIGLRARYEVQIKGDYGEPPDTHSSGALYSRIIPTRNASKPAGEWQTYDVRLVGRYVTIVVNGATVISKGFVEGLTAMASDPNEGQPGPISLQGDHGVVEFRRLTVTPLEKQ